MWISCQWLSRHVDLEGVDLVALGDRFTLAVAELEGISEVGAELKTVVVGHVQEVHPIEGSRVQRTVVDTGAHGIRQIVCGAPNVAAGQNVPVALPGTQLGEITIQEAVVRGVPSAGMIASEKELGVGEAHEGIWVIEDDAAPGTSLLELYPFFRDTLFEIDNKSLTHRPDLWGHRGLAREIAALVDRPLKPLNLDVTYTSDTPLTLRVEAPKACPRYSAVTCKGVTIAPSPRWLSTLLYRVGTRPINNVVDLTNFVMLDLGNPLHAFDRREVRGDAITVRFANPGERFTTLDDVERELTPTDLLISDGEGGVALAGIMGGADSEIREDTSDIVLEAANFDAATVRMSSQRLGLRTESSARFEKSLDPHLVEEASRAFCHHLQALLPEVSVTSAFMDVAEPIDEPPIIDLPVELVQRRLGVALSTEEVQGYLTRIGFGVSTPEPGLLKVTVPTWRATKDIDMAMDLVEEIGRSYGYDNITPCQPQVSLARPHPNAQKRFERKARRVMSERLGFDEVMTYSFDSDPLLAKLDAVPNARLILKNPISAEMTGMRTSIIPNLLSFVERNHRSVDALRFYEVGRIFIPSGDAQKLPDQPVTLSAVWAQSIADPDPDATLFFHMKGVVESLARGVGRTVQFTQGGVAHPWAHPVRQAEIRLDDAVIGHLAEIHPVTSKALGLRLGVSLFELNLDVLRAGTETDVSYAPLPKYPAVYRDFAVVVDEKTSAGQVEAALRASTTLVKELTLQSVYRGEGVEPGHKCIAYSVVLQNPDRTLQEEEIREAERAIWASLANQVQGQPRVVV